MEPGACACTAGSPWLVGLAGLGALLDCALEQQCVYERLGEIAAQLALADVELLRAQARWPARGAVSLKPPRGSEVIALLGVRRAP